MTVVNCLICNESYNARKGNMKEFIEILSDLFSVFSNYMKWNPPTKYHFDFFNDNFPFCKACDLILVKVLRLHEQILDLQKQIEQLCLGVNAKILISEKDLTSRRMDALRESTGDATTEAICKAELVTCNEKTEYYRSIVIKGYSPFLKLTPADISSFVQISQAELVPDKNTTMDSSWIDPPDFEPESPSDQDMKFEVDFEEDLPDNEDSRDQSSDKSSSSSSSSETTDHEPVSDPEVADDTSVLLASNSKEPDQDLGLDAIIPSGESLYPCKVTLFDSTKYEGGYTQTAPNKYLMDSKCPFIHENRWWKCLACDKAYFKADELIKHLKTGLGCPGLKSAGSSKTLTYKLIKYDRLRNGNFECRRCPSTSFKRSKIQSHIDSLHVSKDKAGKIPTFQTALFIQSGPNMLIMNGEFEVELKDGKYRCTLCSSFRLTQKAIADHILRKHASKLRAPAIQIKEQGPNKFSFDSKYCCEFIDEAFKCCECSYNCKTIGLMRRHMRFEHIKSMSKLVCETCGFGCYSRSNLENHQRRHTDDRHIECTHCSKKFKSKDSLYAHKAKYHRELLNGTAVLCEVCGMEFSRQCDLNVHMHKKHEFVNCKICSKQYAVSKLAFHMQSHAQNKFECSECGKKFTYSIGLSTHQKSCKGDKPYSCDICDMRFTQSYSVTRHKIVVHRTSSKAKTTSKSLTNPTEPAEGES